jgi:hypothetical protein
LQWAIHSVKSISGATTTAESTHPGIRVDMKQAARAVFDQYQHEEQAEGGGGGNERSHATHDLAAVPGRGA